MPNAEGRTLNVENKKSFYLFAYCSDFDNKTIQQPNNPII
jgi:hypothetical protein